MRLAFTSFQVFSEPVCYNNQTCSFTPQTAALEIIWYIMIDYVTSKLVIENKVMYWQKGNRKVVNENWLFSCDKRNLNKRDCYNNMIKYDWTWKQSTIITSVEYSKWLMGSRTIQGFGHS